MLEVVLEELEASHAYQLALCFNPYFAGSSSGSRVGLLRILRFGVVSILILLEVVLEAMLDARGTIRDSGFNPYFAGSSSGSSAT